MTIEGLLIKAKAASRELALVSDEQKKEILLKVADAICSNKELLLRENAKDLSRMEKENPLYDRLQLTDKRLDDIASDMRHVAALESPLGKTLKQSTLPNGLRLRRVSVPFGVIGVVYEARPNVTYDVFSLCFKTGNACVLKGGKDADDSNRAGVALIKNVLREYGLEEAIQLPPATHEATGEMLAAVGYIDLCIPRGSKRLITFVRDTAKVPVIETGAGVVNTYLDADADIDMATSIVCNAKTRRVSVCNALDCLIVNVAQLQNLYKVCSPMAEKNVIIYADSRSYEALDGKYPAELLQHAADDSFGTEFMDYKMAIKTVDSLTEALEHIARYGSGHSESIITRDEEAAHQFQQRVDAACVYWNAPTSFTDGAQFGLGAEIGISTQKLGARGPMGLEEITTYKWLIEGVGQTRP
jgi:glutamate-5-semialdehyde dehydrogenase